MKHGYPNIKKAQPRINVATHEENDAGNSSSLGAGASVSSNTGFSQERLVQLASLLQQANLVVPSSQATSNHIAATPLISTSICAHESSSASIIPKPSYLLLDSEANEQISLLSLLFQFIL